MHETLFIFLLKLYFNIQSFHHLADTDAVRIFLPFSFTGAFFMCIYEYIEDQIDLIFSSIQTVF